MEKKLQRAVSERLRELLMQDSRNPCPVVQSVSLFFWENLERWVRQIALVPEPFVIALTGPSGCGKSFIRQTIVDRLSVMAEVTSFTQDNYYRDFEADFPHLPLDRFYNEINLDDPAHIRFRHLARDLQRFKSQSFGSVLHIPRLRFGTPVSKPSIVEADQAFRVTPFLVTEGIHAFYDPVILPFYNFKIYVEVDETVRRERWLARNRLENRGVTENMWNTTVECLHQNLLPTRALADLVINNNAPQAQVASFLENVIAALASPLVASQREIA